MQFKCSLLSWKQISKFYRHSFLLFLSLSQDSDISRGHSILILFLSFLFAHDLGLNVPIIDSGLKLSQKRGLFHREDIGALERIISVRVNICELDTAHGRRTTKLALNVHLLQWEQHLLPIVLCEQDVLRATLLVLAKLGWVL